MDENNAVIELTKFYYNEIEKKNRIISLLENKTKVEPPSTNPVNALKQLLYNTTDYIKDDTILETLNAIEYKTKKLIIEQFILLYEQL